MSSTAASVMAHDLLDLGDGPWRTGVDRAPVGIDEDIVLDAQAVPQLNTTLDGDAVSDDDIVLGRCNMAQTNGDYFATTAENCLGAFRETIIGYIAKSPRPGFVPLYRYFKKSKEERWMTTLPIEKLGDSEYVLEKIEGYVSPVSLSPASAPSPAPSSSP